ncbi:MAG: hypothetical protein KGZ59_06075 [Chitinophagaceae bacterium]|nr:hypothetical protein [Chitinophagaceae bacterium]
MSIENTKSTTRRRIIKWGSLGSLAIIFYRFNITKIFSSNKEAISCGTTTVKTTKMLTQDGRLVEVEISKIAKENKSRITTTELKSWIHKKTS